MRRHPLKKDIVDDIHELLKQHGITFLTSEACGVSLRGLFDLTPEGQGLLEEALGGMQANYPGWNDWEGKSVMLFYAMLRPLAIYLLLRDGADAVLDVNVETGIVYANHLVAIYDLGRDPNGVITDPEYQAYLERANVIFEGKYLVFWRSGTARNGMRNQHVFSGRIE
jgi:hypothetical protein